MESLGWSFVPVSHECWEWIKFDLFGEALAREGSEVWRKDLVKMPDIDETNDYTPFGKAADQTIRKMIREEIERERKDKPIKPYPNKEQTD